MRIKLKNSELNVSGLLLLAGILILDNVYANHCKKKTVSELVKCVSKEEAVEILKD